MKFPLELDVLDLVTDELKNKILPVSEKLKQVERERAERRKIRRKTKPPRLDLSTSIPIQVVGLGDGPTTINASLTQTVGQVPAGLELRGSVPVSPEGNAEQAKGVPTRMGAREEELIHRQRERQELEALIPEDLKKDIGCSATGLYELVGMYYLFSFLVGCLFMQLYIANRHRHAQGCCCRLWSLHWILQENHVPPGRVYTWRRATACRKFERG